MSQITKRAMEAALKKLLLEKPLTKITVSDITEECGMNRMTFYYHFKDMYDLVEWCCEEDARAALDGKKTHDTWQQGLLQIFYAVKENKSFIMNVYRCVSRERVEQFLYPQVYHLVRGVLDEEVGDRSVSENDKEFIANFYKYGFVGLMLEWIRCDMRTKPEELVDQLSLLLEGSMEAALQRCASHQPR